MKTIGVLALQGAFLEHECYLNKCIDKNDYDIKVQTVKTPAELELCDALIIPGGESTAISQIAERTGLYEHLYNFVRDRKKAVWGTCAGLIFLASELRNESELVKTLGILKVSVERNAFGRQSHSFVSECDFSSFLPEGNSFPAVFIRAPVIDHVIDERNVKVLHKLTSPQGNELIVAVRQGNILATSFHPELADDIRFHEWFINEFVI